MEKELGVSFLNCLSTVSKWLVSLSGWANSATAARYRISGVTGDPLVYKSSRKGEEIKTVHWSWNSVSFFPLILYLQSQFLNSVQQATLQKGHEKIFYNLQMISNEIEKITPRKETLKLEQVVLGSLSNCYLISWFGHQSIKFTAAF